jgi:hypothetical protein
MMSSMAGDASDRAGATVLTGADSGSVAEVKLSAGVELNALCAITRQETFVPAIATVSVRDEVVTFVPAIATVSVRDEVVSPAMAPPLLNHWYVNVGVVSGLPGVHEPSSVVQTSPTKAPADVLRTGRTSLVGPLRGVAAIMFDETVVPRSLLDAVT